LLRAIETTNLRGRKFGGAERDRTADPLLAKQVLSQLSYSPNPGTGVTGERRGRPIGSLWLDVRLCYVSVPLRDRIVSAAIQTRDPPGFIPNTGGPR
jgi:hypothetical protein